MPLGSNWWEVMIWWCPNPLYISEGVFRNRHRDRIKCAKTLLWETSMKENREGDLKGCACLQIVPVWSQWRREGRTFGSESASGCWAIEGQFSKVVESPWTRVAHQRNPMEQACLKIPAVLSNWLWAVPREACVNVLMEFRAQQQGTWFSDAPCSLWSERCIVMATTIHVQSLSPTWYLGTM